MRNSQTRSTGRRYSLPHPVLTLLLLLLCCAAGCLAAIPHRCMFDELMRGRGAPATTVVREIPRKGQGAVQAYTASTTTEGDTKDNQNWAPIRIKAFTRNLDDPSKYCTAAGQQLVSSVGHVKWCDKSSVLTLRKKRIIVEQLIPAAIKLHTDRLLVVREKEIVKVPRDYGWACRDIIIPEEHHTTGMTDADLYLYVSAVPGSGEVGSAIYCHRLANGRPYTGVIDFTPRYVEATEKIVRSMAHEIGHVLGFVGSNLQKHGIVSAIDNVRGKPRVWVVNTSKAKEVARKYYNCSSAPGLELDSDREEGWPGSHWEQRNVLDELMAPSGAHSRYGVMSLALFDSLPYYKANFSMAEPLTWGRNAGCDFLEKKCLENGTSPNPELFCNKYPSQEAFLCTHDRMGLGYCELTRHREDLPTYYQYFQSAKLGGFTIFSDYCPYVRQYNRRGCTNGNLHLMPGSFVGPEARCVKGVDLRFSGRHVGDVCVNTKCENGTLSVQFRDDDDDDKWHLCEEKKTIKPDGGNWSGEIICPRYEEVCTRFPNVTIVLDELPPQDDDDKPAPDNCTWKKTETPSSDPQPHPRGEQTMEDVDKPPVKVEPTLSHPNVPTNPPVHTDVVEEDKIVSQTSSPHSGTMLDQHGTHSDGLGGSQHGSDSQVPTTQTTQSDTVARQETGVEGASSPQAGSTLGQSDAQSKSPKGNEDESGSGDSITQTLSSGKTVEQSSDARSNVGTNGGDVPSVSGHGGLLTLNIGLGDGSVTPAGCAPLLLLVFAGVVAVAVPL